jgi:hypothetical protein
MSIGICQIPDRVYRGGLAPQILVGFFFKGPPNFFFVFDKKGQSEVQNSSADEKKKKVIKYK